MVSRDVHSASPRAREQKKAGAVRVAVSATCNNPAHPVVESGSDDKEATAMTTITPYRLEIPTDDGIEIVVRHRLTIPIDNGTEAIIEIHEDGYTVVHLNETESVEHDPNTKETRVNTKDYTRVYRNNVWTLEYDKKTREIRVNYDTDTDDAELERQQLWQAADRW